MNKIKENIDVLIYNNNIKSNFIKVINIMQKDNKTTDEINELFKNPNIIIELLNIILKNISTIEKNNKIFNKVRSNIIEVNNIIKKSNKTIDEINITLEILNIIIKLSDEVIKNINIIEKINFIFEHCENTNNKESNLMKDYYNKKSIILDSNLKNTHKMLKYTKEISSTDFFIKILNNIDELINYINYEELINTYNNLNNQLKVYNNDNNIKNLEDLLKVCNDNFYILYKIKDILEKYNKDLIPLINQLKIYRQNYLKLEDLTTKLNEANKNYYEDNIEKITNAEYDFMYDKLLELEKNIGIFLDYSPSNNVGYEVLEKLEKVEHDKAMLSLDKTKDISVFKKFLGNKTGLLSWKLDGLTVVIKYNNGKLKQAITRGNGLVGEDITHNVNHFKNLPKIIDYKGELVIRGEAIITYSDFEKINQKLDVDAKYKNPRNLCSGTVRQLNSKVLSERNVKFILFSTVTELDNGNLKQYDLEWLKKQGFEVVEYLVTNINKLEEDVNYFKNKIENYDIPSDGLVLTFDDKEYSKSLGVTSKFPKDSIAFKWQDEVAETKLLDIVWNTSRTGLINPVAVFEPVVLEGTTVNRASLHNLSIAENLKLGIGDTLKVYKANMIIPQVLENLTCSNNFNIPKKCSVCNSDTEIIKQNKTKMLYCTNPNCSAQVLKSITHYVSRNAMNIENMSEATINKFINNNIIKNYVDIYMLNFHEDDIINLDGFSQKSYKRLLDSIEKSKRCSLPNFIYALGIRHFGISNANDLCKYYNYDINKIKLASKEELLSINGFGEIRAHSLYNYFNDKNNLKLLDNVLKYLTFEKENNIDSSIKDLTFVITGKLNNFENRKQLQKVIEQNGAKVMNSVTSKTSYLINNDINSKSSKNQTAIDLKIPIITEEEFLKLLN